MRQPICVSYEKCCATIDNSTTFEGKMQRLVDTAAGLCGIPTTVRASRKYLLATTPFEIPFHHEDFEVEKVYLKPEAASALACIFSSVSLLS